MWQIEYNKLEFGVEPPNYTTVNLGNFLGYKWECHIVPLYKDDVKYFDFFLSSRTNTQIKHMKEPSIQGEYQAQFGFVSRTSGEYNGEPIRVLRVPSSIYTNLPFQARQKIKFNLQFQLRKYAGIEIPKSLPPLVKLNVGGTIFQTTMDSIDTVDSLIKRNTILHTFNIMCPKDESDNLFFNRDPKHFRLILGYLRNQTLNLPDKDYEIAEIQEEAKFYMIDDLVELCEEKLKSKTLPTTTDIVKLDIGGTVFKTTQTTLTRFDGMFKTMLDNGIMTTVDGFLTTFIDRSPKHFDLILNYMRDGDVTLPESYRELKEILKEAQYYLLGGLVEMCENVLMEMS